MSDFRPMLQTLWGIFTQHTLKIIHQFTQIFLFV